jgi:AcrR family transcriptional regulator
MCSKQLFKTNVQGLKMITEDMSTRQRLLNAAAEIFGECGYKGATVRKICFRAGVGVAQVNYHFRDKEGLYLEVYRHLFARALEKYPPTMGLGKNPSSEEKLHAFIRSFLYRLTMVGERHSLLVREMLDPSPALIKLHNEMTMPLQKMLKAILQELLGPGVSEEELTHCVASIVGQCLFCGPHALHFRENAFPSIDTGNIEMLAKNITAFSLGGIQAINKENAVVGDTHEA